MKSLASRLKKTNELIVARLRGGELTPDRLAGSVALGLFIGILPLYGFHFPLCASLALLLRLDVIVTYLAANISIPPMIPVLLYAGLQLGSLMLNGALREISAHELEQASIVDLGEQLLLGSVLLAAAAAIVGGAVSYFVARWLLSRRSGAAEPELAAALARTRERYRGAPRQHRYYVSSKLRMDPLTRELFEATRHGVIRGSLLDVGTGRGQFAVFLAELGAIDAIVGFDHDQEKIDVAVDAGQQLTVPSRFSLGDLRAQPLQQADTILLLDVLHYLNTLEQDAVLSRAAMALRSGGYLFVRETNRGSSWGAYWAGQLERLARALRINRGERLVFRSPAEYEQTLRQLGLVVKRAQGRGALDNVLLVARHPGPPHGV